MSALTRKGSPEKRFIFLVSFAPGPTGPGPAERLMKVGARLDQDALARFPLLWHLPAADIDGACARLLHDRSEAYGDAVVPMGLTGAPHPLLHIAEIESDIEWSMSNLWHTGVADALHTRAPMVIPRTPDFLRDEAHEAYGASAVPVGMLGTADDGLWISTAPTGVAPTEGALPVLDAESIGEPGRRTLVRALARRQRDAKSVGGARPVVVRCRIATEDDIERLVATFASAAEALEKTKWSVAPLDLEAAAGPKPDLIAADVPHLAPSAATTATELRRRRSSKINTRRILEHVASDGPGDSASGSASGGSGDAATARPQTPPRPPERGE
ncbi:MAG TPA: hypothetical protein VKA06_07815, partial [Spirochaetia bacterium]|nr:hypothetical protein [Spirochaetia bacterium]